MEIIEIINFFKILENIFWFAGIAIIPFALFIHIYNYTTKYIREPGSWKITRVYSIGGLIIRCLFSIMPMVNIFPLFVGLFEPGYVNCIDCWYDIKTNKISRRSNFFTKWHEHWKLLKEKTIINR